MSLELWLAFVAACALVLAIPGPTALTVVSYSLAHGQRARLPVVAGVALGDSIALAFSLVGLGLLLETSAFWFNVLKMLGGLYLLCLGIALLRARPAAQGLAIETSSQRSYHLFANTCVVTALNPKSIVFFVAFLPQFLSSDARTGPQLWLLAVTFVALATLTATLFAVFATSARNLLEGAGSRHRLNVGGGLVLIGAGLWTLLARRP